MPRDRKPWTYWTAVFFKYLTIIVLAGLILHMLLDVWKYYRHKKGWKDAQ
jgi:uncharacterized membrane protein